MSNNPNSPIELEHLVDGPGEQTNMDAQYPDIVTRIAGIMGETHEPSESFLFRFEQVSENQLYFRVYN